MAETSRSTAESSATAAPEPSLAEPCGRWRILAVLSIAQLLGMSLWFTASATSAQLAALWSLEPGGAAFLTTTVQIGFVGGTALAALLNLADVIPARRYFAISAIAAAAANAALLFAPGPGVAAVSRFLTGFFLAGVYPPAMKMAATWFRSGRGLAIGTVVGALTVGKALPYLISAFAALDYRYVIVSTSLGALVSAALVATAYRDGPFPFPSRPFSLSLVGIIVRHRQTRLAIGGYLGHMWELYACWAALSIFLTDVFRGHGYGNLESAGMAAMSTFAAIAVGGLGSVLAGKWADRLGREAVASAAMAVSGLCAVSIGWLISAPPWLVLAVAVTWGFAIVADSAQFSALVTEVAPSHAVGTALTLQTSLGFLLTAASIWLTIEVANRWGWGVAFSMLAIGPAFGIWQMAALRRTRNQMT
ncbi:MAG TPA: MFS transporter [Longimicrobiales bacterium]|nr:MFS transporter [Longimicrobiales bacterium]